MVDCDNTLLVIAKTKKRKKKQKHYSSRKGFCIANSYSYSYVGYQWRWALSELVYHILVYCRRVMVCGCPQPSISSLRGGATSGGYVHLHEEAKLPFFCQTSRYFILLRSFLPIPAEAVCVTSYAG